jgi:hypothetical protein
MAQTQKLMHTIHANQRKEKKCFAFFITLCQRPQHRHVVLENLPNYDYLALCVSADKGGWEEGSP